MKEKISAGILSAVFYVLIVQLAFGAGFFEQGTAPAGGYPSAPTFTHVGTGSVTATDNITGTGATDLKNFRNAYITNNIVGSGGNISGYRNVTGDNTGSLTGYFAGQLRLTDNNALDNVSPLLVNRVWMASPSGTAAVNDAAITAALARLAATGKPAILEFSPGTIEVSAEQTILPSDSSLMLKGHGRNTVFKWVGADNATAFHIGEEEYGAMSLTNNVFSIDGIDFDLNNKATCAWSFGSGKNLQVKNFGLFNGKSGNQSPPLGMLDIGTANYAAHVSNGWFFGGTTPAISINRYGRNSGPVGVNLSDLYFGMIDNNLLWGKNIVRLSLKNIVIDGAQGIYFNTGGFTVDQVSSFTAKNIYAEQLAKGLFDINRSNAAGSIVLSGSIQEITCVYCGTTGINDNLIYLGKTQSMKIADLSFLSLVGDTVPVKISADARLTRIGKIYSYDGEIYPAEDAVSDSGVGTIFESVFVPAVNSVPILALDNQSEVTWVNTSNISTILSGVPETARGWMVRASIKSGTKGARLYVGKVLQTPLWSSRDTDARVQYLEATDNTSYHTGTFILPAAASFQYRDQFPYGIGNGGTTNTDVEIRLIGWYESP